MNGVVLSEMPFSAAVEWKEMRKGAQKPRVGEIKSGHEPGGVG